ncbi:MAG: DUF1080 domain-containing protein [Candidatus Nealsonbacteria bacterium]|nr:DUF1080 domain-containing protein [Candidatus Nealsonbacteria bacterium]
MNILKPILTLVLLLVPLVATAAEDGWVTLFDGKNLDAWTMGPNKTWAVEDGVITLNREMNGGLHNDDYLWTKETYGNFVLELEYKIPERANSGIFIRTADLKDPVYTGIEVQVANSFFFGREGISRGGTAGAIYDCVAPTKNTVKQPGEWNACRVTCLDNKIVVELNGQQIVDMDLDRWTTAGKNPDGTTNKFRNALKDFARTGHVGLQDHGRPVWYRNVRIKRLDKPAFTLVPDEFGKVLKAPDGRTVWRYMTKKPAKTNLSANSVCCLYPVFTPSSQRAVDFAPGDHRHHRGVFLAWHFTEGQKPADFWGWGEMAPTEGRVIKNKSVELVAADVESAKLAVRNDWVIGTDVMIEEALAVTTRQVEDVWVIDMTFELTPKVDSTLKQTAFGGFCVKGRKEGKAYYTDPKGKVNRPDPHHLKPETDWPGVDWYDYTIDMTDGKTLGVTVVDHPKNPPSTWHNLGPIAMVNPCIVAPGAVKLPAGKPLTLRYRLVVHDGPPPMELLKKLSAEFRRQ